VLNQVLAGVILVLILDLVKRIREIKDVSHKDLRILFLISLFTAVFGPLLFLIGLKLTSATNTILIGKSEALLTSLIAVYFLKDKVSWHQVVGALIMFFGIVLIATQTFTLGFSINIGDLLILLSSLLFAIGTVLFKKYAHHVPPEVIVTLRNLFGATILLVLSIFFVKWPIEGSFLSVKFILAMLGMVVLTTIGGQWLWYKALELTSATKVSLAGLSSPLIAVIYAVILLGESLSSSQIIGGVAIMIGLFVLEHHKKKTHSKEKRKHHLKIKHWPHV